MTQTLSQAIARLESASKTNWGYIQIAEAMKIIRTQQRMIERLADALKKVPTVAELDGDYGTDVLEYWHATDKQSALKQLESELLLFDEK